MIATLWYKVVGIALLFAAIAGSYWYTYDAGISHQKDVAIIATAKANDIATEKYNALWEQYSAKQVVKVAESKVVHDQVVKVVERAVYKNVCIDADGLALANKALSGGKP